MRFSIRAAAFAAIGLGAVNLASAQGPIREGLRNTGEAAANVTRGVVEGTADVARSLGGAAVDTVRGTGRIAGNALGITPNTPIQARAGANLAAGDQGRDARWRFARHNGEWWYYSPQNNWMYHRDGDWARYSEDSFQPLNQDQQFAQNQPIDQGQQYSSGYRGVDQGGQMSEQQGQWSQHQGAHQQVRHDRHGRAYICENGRPLYLDEGQFQGEMQQDQAQMSPTPAVPQEYSAARQDLDQQNLDQQNRDQQTAPQQPAEQSTLQSDQATQPGAVPATPQPSASTSASGSGDVSTTPAGSESSSQVQPGVASPREINNNPTSQTQGAAVNPEQ